MEKVQMQSGVFFKGAAMLMVVTCLVAGCSKKIDGTSLQTIASSAQEMGASMTSEERKQLDRDLSVIMNTPGLTVGDFRARVSGKSASDLRSMAQALIDEAAKIKLREDQARLIVLQQAQMKAAKEAKIVEAVQLKVVSAQLEPQKWGDQQQFTLLLDVENGSSEAIEQLRYDAHLAWENRSITRQWYINLSPPIPAGTSRQVRIEHADFEGASGGGDLTKASIGVKVKSITPPQKESMYLENPLYFGPREKGELEGLLATLGSSKN